MRLPVRRSIGLGTGALVGLAVVLWLHAPGQAHLRAPGPMNPGHADLGCEACHRPAQGTVRQQLQNAARDGLGLAAVPVDMGFPPSPTTSPRAAHVPDDRHPVYRFREPRFAAARAALHPEHCASCHREHAGARATPSSATACSNCHAELVLENDPLDVSHRELVASERWETCLGCHDFHGNHGMRAPTRLDQALPAAAILDYLRSGPSPIQRRSCAPSRRRPSDDQTSNTKSPWRTVLVVAVAAVTLWLYLFVSAPPLLASSSAPAGTLPIADVLAMLERENDAARALWTEEMSSAGPRSGSASTSAGTTRGACRPLPALFLRETARNLERSPMGLSLFLGSPYP